MIKKVVLFYLRLDLQRNEGTIVRRRKLKLFVDPRILVDSIDDEEKKKEFLLITPFCLEELLQQKKGLERKVVRARR